MTAVRHWARRLAPVAAAALLVWLLGATLGWVLLWWAAASVLWLCGWILGHAAGCAKAAEQCQRWQDQCDAFEAELTQADAAIEQLHRDRDIAWQAGIVQGQLLRHDREEHGL